MSLQGIIVPGGLRSELCPWGVKSVYSADKGGLMQHSVPDEWNAWSIQRNSLGKFSVLNRSNITPAMIPRHHTRNGRIIRIGVLSDPASGKVSFVNATVRPRRIIHSFRHGLFLTKPSNRYYGP